MELRQLRYFVRIVELGSMGRAAAKLGVATATRPAATIALTKFMLISIW